MKKETEELVKYRTNRVAGEMLGIIYVIFCTAAGRELAGNFLFDMEREQKRAGHGRFAWVFWSAAFGVGTLAVTWAVYLVSWAASALAGAEQPLFFGNLIVMVLGISGLILVYLKRFRKKNGKSWRIRRPYSRELLAFMLLMVFLTWIMFYVFHIKGGILYSGFSVYGDYAPHTAMMRSFSLGNNFPTQYPHYGGSDVKYHFMFQFLAGNLEYLGMRMDAAYNLVSILSLLGFLMVLYSLAVRITGKRVSGAAAVLLFFFRSSLSFFRFLAEHIQAGDLLEILKDNTAFIGYTTNENWGLWNFNVYLNQRHLAFGLLIVSIALWIYLDWMEDGDHHAETGFRWMKDRLFTKEAWICKAPDRALAVGIMIGLCAFWNGAAVIGGLLILMGFALFSDGKLDYLLTALAAVAFSVLQTRLFIRENAMSLTFQWGFLAEDQSLAGVIWYLLQMSGIFFLGVVLLAVFLKRRERALLTAFLIPVLFAFCISLTPDITVNHKYIMISYAFLTMFWADALVKIWKNSRTGKAAAVVLAVCLTITGIYDFVIILRDNDRSHRVAVNMNSSLTGWLAENLDSRDLLLTPEYSINEVTMSGVMMYCGWPYYAWSAGYDTYYRADIAVEIYTTDDAETVRTLAKQEGITYILYEENMTFEQAVCREDVIAAACPLVYTSEDGRIRIYETGEE